MNSLTRAVKYLLIVNIAVFLAGLAPGWEGRILRTGGLWFPGDDNFQAWQVVTYMFLHGSFNHILFNMVALVSFGTVLEREWGENRFLLFYFLCGIGAGLVQLGVNWYEAGDLHAKLVALGMAPADIAQLMRTGRGNIPDDAAAEKMLQSLYQIHHGSTVGASGAIYGLLVAFACLHPNAKLALIFVPVPIAAKFFIPVLLALDLFSGVTGFSLFGAGVAHFAHIGGALIGFVLMLLWRRRRATPPPLAVYEDLRPET